MTTKISMLAIDLAKGSFQVCAVGPDGAVLYNRGLSRTRLAVARHRSWDCATSQVVGGDGGNGAAIWRRDQVAMSLFGVAISSCSDFSVSLWLSRSVSLSDVAAA